MDDTARPCKTQGAWSLVGPHGSLQVRGWRDVRYATRTSTCTSSLVLVQPVFEKATKSKVWTAFCSSARTLAWIIHPIAVPSSWRFHPNLEKARNHISLIDKFAVNFWKCDWWTWALVSHKGLALVMFSSVQRLLCVLVINQCICQHYIALSLPLHGILVINVHSTVLSFDVKRLSMENMSHGNFVRTPHFSQHPKCI